MRSLLLFALLVHVAFGEEEAIVIKEKYQGEECNKLLKPNDYFTNTLDNGVKSSINGNPHYLWGSVLACDECKTLFCARVTSEKSEKVNERTWQISDKEIGGGTVKRVQVYDRKTPEKGGSVEISERYRKLGYTTIRFKSLKNKPMDYVVAIIGRPKK